MAQLPRGRQLQQRGRPRKAVDLTKRATRALENHIKLAEERWTAAEKVTDFFKRNVLQAQESWSERTLEDFEFAKPTAFVAETICAEAATAKMVRRDGCGIKAVLIHDTGRVKVPVPFPAIAVAATKTRKQGPGRTVRRWEPHRKASLDLLGAYFTWLASSHWMAARSNSVKEVTPNFSFARAQ
jgi:hypothetical protein